ncbi:hypothetical protein B0H11DRAFT_2375710 [Mycena galericulata]|nr:hypothetical protein B0H11DRAFT_2375710 [Mycena galericulata]
MAQLGERAYSNRIGPHLGKIYRASRQPLKSARKSSDDENSNERCHADQEDELSELDIVYAPYRTKEIDTLTGRDTARGCGVELRKVKCERENGKSTAPQGGVVWPRLRCAHEIMRGRGHSDGRAYTSTARHELTIMHVDLRRRRIGPGWRGDTVTQDPRRQRIRSLDEAGKEAKVRVERCSRRGGNRAVDEDGWTEYLQQLARGARKEVLGAVIRRDLGNAVMGKPAFPPCRV